MTTDSAKKVMDAVVDFAKRCSAELGIEQPSLFGSLVYLDGARFSKDVSDVDLAVAMPTAARRPIERVELAQRLRQIKEEFEGRLAIGLSRTTTVPVCSLLLLSRTDIGADIHKDGAEGFFAANEFLDLLTDTRSHGLPGTGDKNIRHRLVRQCLRFAQKKRHAYLGVAADGSGSLPPYQGDMPLPKDLLRHAAMAAAIRKPGGAPGAEFDIQEGLGELLRVVIDAAGSHPAYEELRAWLLNRTATGKGVLNAEQQLLLAEIIGFLAEDAFDKAEKERQGKQPTRPAMESTPFFYERVGEAFPGKRGIYWTSGPDDVALRLTSLLGGKLRFANSTPIWMFRGGISVPIDHFVQSGPETFMLAHQEMKVSRLALHQSEDYYRCFVYVECEPLAPIGIYDHTAETAKRVAAEGGFYTEEYGVTDDGLLLTRAEYDDGAAERDGKIIRTNGRAEIRSRYLTPFNFVLCAQMCPINNSRYDRQMGELLDRMLVGEDLLAEFVGLAESLPRRDLD